MWIIFVFSSAVFASLTSILGKIGIIGVELNLGTAIRTIVVPIDKLSSLVTVAFSYLFLLKYLKKLSLELGQ